METKTFSLFIGSGRGNSLLAVLLVLIGFQASAQMLTDDELALRSRSANWVLPVNVEGSSSVQKSNQYEYAQGMTIESTPAYHINKRLDVISILGAYRNFVDNKASEDADLENTLLGLKLKTTMNSRSIWNNTLSVTLPTNKTLRDETTYQGSFGASTSMVFSDLFLHSELVGALSYKRNVHEYTQAIDRSFNARDVVKARVDYSVPFLRHFYFGTMFSYQSAWNYEDTQSFKFVASAEIDYELTQKLTAYVGTSNEGNALRANGADSNIALFDDTTSVVKLGLNYLF